MDEHKRQRERERAHSAQRLLDDPMLSEAYTGLREKILAAWPGAADVEKRERLWRELHALDAIWSRLRDVVTTGRMADEQLSRGKQ